MKEFSSSSMEELDQSSLHIKHPCRDRHDSAGDQTPASWISGGHYQRATKEARYYPDYSGNREPNNLKLDTNEQFFYGREDGNVDLTLFAPTEILPNIYTLCSHNK